VLIGVHDIVVHGVSKLVFLHRREGLLERHVVVRAVVEVAKPVHDAPKCLGVEAVGEVMDVKRPRVRHRILVNVSREGVVGSRKDVCVRFRHVERSLR
jgi:hypothetical protein